jgi:hyperosmotically inducible periplasmic protein
MGEFLMFKRMAVAIGVCLLGVVTLLPSPAQERRLGERIGERIDRGIEALRQEWTQLRESVDRMGVQGRVYSRLRWDKEIETRGLDVEVQGESTVVLQGYVQSAEAKEKAVRLARDTVGVTRVVDELVVAAPEQPEPER